MKKAVSILLTLALALSAAACQSKEPAPAESSSGPDASSTAPVSTDSFPSAPITFNLTGSAGSGTDVLFRALASSIEETSDAKMVCVTAYWSPSMVATIEAPADGYTICGLPSANICRSLVDTATEDHNYKDMQVLCSVASSDLVIGVLADDERFSDVNDIADLVEWCKANPDEDLLLACGSQSSISMIATCLFLEAAGLQDQITILNSSDDN